MAKACASTMPCCPRRECPVPLHFELSFERLHASVPGALGSLDLLGDPGLGSGARGLLGSAIHVGREETEALTTALSGCASKRRSIQALIGLLGGEQVYFKSLAALSTPCASGGARVRPRLKERQEWERSPRRT